MGCRACVAAKNVSYITGARHYYVRHYPAQKYKKHYWFYCIIIIIIIRCDMRQVNATFGSAAPRIWHSGQETPPATWCSITYREKNIIFNVLSLRVQIVCVCVETLGNISWWPQTRLLSSWHRAIYLRCARLDKTRWRHIEFMFCNRHNM